MNHWTGPCTITWRGVRSISNEAGLPHGRFGSRTPRFPVRDGGGSAPYPDPLALPAAPAAGGDRFLALPQARAQGQHAPSQATPLDFARSADGRGFAPGAFVRASLLGPRR